MEMIAKKVSLMMMKEKNVHFSNHTHVQRIENGTVYAERDGEQLTFKDQDIIVMAVGMKSYNPLENELRNLLKGKDVPIHVIGDAQVVGDAQDAINAGYEVAQRI